MGLPKVVIRGKEIILLSGYTDRPDGKARGAGVRIAIEAEDKLLLAIQNDPDAIAFGRVAGRWVAGA